MKKRIRFGPRRPFPFTAGDVIKIQAKNKLLPPGHYEIVRVEQPFVRLKSKGRNIYTVEISLLGKCLRCEDSAAKGRRRTQKQIQKHLLKFVDDYLF